MIKLPRSQRGKTPLEVAKAAAQRAGEIVAAHFMGQRKLSHKGRGNVVTDVDFLSERALLEHLRGEYPDHNILTEESTGVSNDSPFTWVLDPLDGSRNYASAIPHFGVNVALTRGDEVLVAVTYDPVRRELFSAERGGGAWLNDVLIAASEKTTVYDSVIGFDMGYQDEPAREALEMVLSFWPGVQTLRVMGSAALGLAYAACGRLDLYFHHDLRPWDLVCGLLLVREAGGVVTEADGRTRAGLKSARLIAGGQGVHKDFLRVTGEARWRG